MVHSTTDIISCFEAEQRNTVFSALSEYLSTGQYVDISLVCKGQVLRAHKVVLSSSSKYFKDFFRHRPGVNIIDLDKELAPNDLSLTLEDVQLIIGILYCVGTVEISPQRIETLLICAQVLGIPTLISFLKKIRDSISDSGKIVKERQFSERERATLPGLPLLSPHNKILSSSRSFSSSTTARRNSSDMMYLLPSPASQYPATIYPPHTPINSIQPPASFSPIPASTFSRAGDTPSPRTPLLDLSVVKPLTASCVPSPESGPSPVAGPSGLQQATARARASPRRAQSAGSDERAGGVQDSLLSASVPKADPESAQLYRRESSRISTASYSSFTLNYLGSGSPRLKSTDVPSNDNHQSLDGFDQNFFMSLNPLQANQIDDLENVLLPHLMDRPDHGLLDLNTIDDVENNQDDENDISTTSPEEGTPSNQTPIHDISGGFPEGEDDRQDITMEEQEDTSDGQNKESTDMDRSSNEPENLTKPTDHQDNITVANQQIIVTHNNQDLLTENDSISETKNQENPERSNTVATEILPEKEKPDETVREKDNDNQVISRIPSQDLAITTVSVGQGFITTTTTSTSSIEAETPKTNLSLTPVRITPYSNVPEVVTTPIRLTPQGSIALTPIKNLMPDNSEDDASDEPDGPDGGDEASDNSGEIVMNLDSVCEGQRMKFSIPGKSQAITVNFSVEALQEMKNAALNGGGGSRASDNQYSEITSSERTKETETSQSNKAMTDSHNYLTELNFLT